MIRYLVLIALLPLTALTSNCSGLLSYSDNCLIGNSAELSFSATYTHETKTLESHIILSGTALTEKLLIHQNYCNFALSILPYVSAADVGNFRNLVITREAFAFYQEDTANTAKCVLSVVLDNNTFTREESFSLKVMKLEGYSLNS